MAILGLTKLEAVNAMLESINQSRFSALDSAGDWPLKTYTASIGSSAEYILDRVSRSVQGRGWKFNVVRCKPYTLGAPGVITFGTNVYAATPAGPNQFRNWAIRSDQAYDLEGDTATFATGTYHFDITTLHDFDFCPPDIKDLIVKEAMTEMQRRFRGDSDADRMIKEETAKAEIRAERPKDSMNAMPLNQTPILPSMGDGGGRRGQ